MKKRIQKSPCLTPRCPNPPFRRAVCKQCYWQARKFVRSQGITMQQLEEQKVLGAAKNASDFRRAHFWNAVQRIKKGNGSTEPVQIASGILEPKTKRGRK